MNRTGRRPHRRKPDSMHRILFTTGTNGRSEARSSNPTSEPGRLVKRTLLVRKSESGRRIPVSEKKDQEAADEEQCTGVPVEEVAHDKFHCGQGKETVEPRVGQEEAQGDEQRQHRVRRQQEFVRREFVFNQDSGTSGQEILRVYLVCLFVEYIVEVQDEDHGKHPEHQH